MGRGCRALGAGAREQGVNPAEFESVIATRLRELLADMAAGAGVSPTRRLRLEGYMQAGVELGLMTRQRCVELLCHAFNAQFNESISFDSPILGEPNATPVDIRIPVRFPVAGDADRPN